MRGWLFEVFFCCVVSFSRTSVILANVLLLSLPFSLFARAWILTFVDWPMLTRLAGRYRTLFILFCVVSGFCILKTLSSNDLKVGRWLCHCA